MKKTVTLLSVIVTLAATAQTAVSVYEAPNTGNRMDRFEHDDNSIYAVRDSSVDRIDAVTNSISLLFKKPWGASVNAKANAIFSNGKSIIGQYIPGSPLKWKYWVYDGSTFDTLFTLAGSQITPWAVDGNVCYFYAGYKIYKSDFTKAGTAAIAAVPSNTLVVDITVFNHDLYFTYTTNSTSNNALKKYSSNVLTTIDSSSGYALSDYKMKQIGNEFFFSHYQVNSVPTSRYKTEISKVSMAGVITNLYTDTTSAGISGKGFMGGLNTTVFLSGSVYANSKENVYQINSVSGGVPTLLKATNGEILTPQSALTYKQASTLVYLDAYDPANLASGDRDLWQTDGTAAGTRKVTAPATANIIHATGFSLGNVDQWMLQGVVCGDKIYSMMSSGELWSEDGTAAPVKVAVPNFFAVGSLAICKGSIFMKGTNSTTYKTTILKMDCAGASGIDKLDGAYKNGLEIFPNPSRGIFEFRIAGLQLEKGQVEIYNMLGASVAFKRNANTIDLSGAVKGIYFVRYTNGTDFYMQKIVIE